MPFPSLSPRREHGPCPACASYTPTGALSDPSLPTAAPPAPQHSAHWLFISPAPPCSVTLISCWSVITSILGAENTQPFPLGLSSPLGAAPHSEVTPGAAPSQLARGPTFTRPEFVGGPCFRYFRFQWSSSKPGSGRRPCHANPRGRGGQLSPRPSSALVAPLFLWPPGTPRSCPSSFHSLTLPRPRRRAGEGSGVFFLLLPSFAHSKSTLTPY